MYSFKRRAEYNIQGHTRPQLRRKLAELATRPRDETKEKKIVKIDPDEPTKPVQKQPITAKGNTKQTQPTTTI
jgi:hypothetical protein